MGFKLSIQMIVRETTNFGALLLRAALDDFFRSGVVNELIIVDNGCSSITKQLLNNMKPVFESRGTVVKIIDTPERLPFNELRNIALKQTDPEATYIGWYDSDETWDPMEFGNLIKELAWRWSQGKIYDKVRTRFYHFMITPDQYQFTPEETEGRYNLIGYNPKLNWIQSVHERLEGYTDESNIYHPDTKYFHFGYTRLQFRRCLIWLYYSFREHNNVNQYKEHEENGKIQDYFRDGEREPNTLLDDRKSVSKLYSGTYSPGTQFWMNLWRQSGKTWEDWLLSIDPTENAFWIRWKTLKEQRGKWKNTLDDALTWYIEEESK